MHVGYGQVVMTRRRNPFPLADALAEFTDSIQPSTPLATMQKAWPGLVGETVAKWSTPVSESGGVVTVECSDSMVAHELSMMSADLLEKLASQVPENRPKQLRYKVV